MQRGSSFWFVVLVIIRGGYIHEFEIFQSFPQFDVDLVRS
jgi:hypothetical protein